ncbi:MAG TPA: ribosome modulation factor [Gammaproteobacteria bacterium]|nr:ribosome modulation factor [Gammaproteobacteria bacterium]
MKRVKRDLEQRAFKKGYNSGIKGHSKEGCPFQENDKKVQWIIGWRTGHADYRAGYRSTD